MQYYRALGCVCKKRMVNPLQALHGTKRLYIIILTSMYPILNLYFIIYAEV